MGWEGKLDADVFFHAETCFIPIWVCRMRRKRNRSFKIYIGVWKGESEGRELPTEPNIISESLAGLVVSVNKNKQYNLKRRGQ